jgi:hypothetical protein
VDTSDVQMMIYETYQDMAASEQDWVRLAKLRPVVEQRMLDTGEVELHNMRGLFTQAALGLIKTGDVHLAPDSNTKALTTEDDVNAVRVGGEDKHLLAVDAGFVPPAPTGRERTVAATQQADIAVDSVTYTTPEVRRNDLGDYRPDRGLETVADLIQEFKETWLATEVTPITTETGVRFEVTGAAEHMAQLAELYGETLPAAGETEPTGVAMAAVPSPEIEQASEPEPAPAPAEPITGEMSSKPLLENTWGEFGREGALHFHTDGPIGTAIEFMGADRMLAVDGEPLANVLGRVATDVVRGRSTAQAGVDALKTLRDRLPEGGRARYYVGRAIEDMDGPNTPLPAVPEGIPQPLRDLVAALHAVPLVRKEPDKELTPLLKLINDFADGKTSGVTLPSRIRELANHRHESYTDCGKSEIDGTIRATAKTLEELPREALVIAGDRSRGREGRQRAGTPAQLRAQSNPVPITEALHQAAGGPAKAAPSPPQIRDHQVDAER